MCFVMAWEIQAGVLNPCKSTTLLCLLKEKADAEESHGYAFYKIPSQELLGKKLLWTDARCLRKKMQNKGFGSQILRDMLQETPSTYGWIGGRIQNPMVMKTYRRTGKTYPFDEDYSSVEGKQIMHNLQEYLQEMRDVEIFDVTVGIARAAYHEGRLGDYPQHIAR